MSLTLEEKQLLRSISDLIARKPDYFYQWIMSERIPQSSVFEKIEPVLSFIKQHPPIEVAQQEYLVTLLSSVERITDKEVRDILKTSLSPI